MKKNLIIFGGIIILLSLTIGFFKTPYNVNTTGRIEKELPTNEGCSISYTFKVEEEVFKQTVTQDQPCLNRHTVNISYESKNPSNNIITEDLVNINPVLKVLEILTFSIGVISITYGTFLYLKPVFKVKNKTEMVPLVEETENEITTLPTSTAIKQNSGTEYHPLPEVSDEIVSPNQIDKTILKSSLPQVLVYDDTPTSEEDRALMFKAGFKQSKKLRKRTQTYRFKNPE